MELENFCPQAINYAAVDYAAGNEVKSERLDPGESLKKYGKRGAILGWYEIQSAFFRALPPDTVQFNTRSVTHFWHFLYFTCFSTAFQLRNCIHLSSCMEICISKGNVLLQHEWM